MNLIQMTVIAGLMILVILLIRHFKLAIVPKVTFVALWLLVMIRLLIPFEMTFGMALPDPFANHPSVSQLAGQQELINHTLNLPIEPIVDNNAIYSTTLSFFNENIMLGVWIVGMIPMTLYFVVNHAKFLRHVSDSIPVEGDILELINKYQSKLKRKIQIRQSQKVVSPLTYGVIKPVILIPKTLNLSQLSQLEYVLAHEYIHVKRFDCFIKIMAAVVLCVHWFNPLVWIMYVLLHRDIELACDEKVLELFGEQAKSTYALTLIHFAEKQNQFSPVYSSFSKHSGIEERIKMMAIKSKKSWVGASLAVLLVSGTMVAFASDTQDYSKPEIPVKETVEREDDPPNLNDDLAPDGYSDIKEAEETPLIEPISPHEDNYAVYEIEPGAVEEAEERLLIDPISPHEADYAVYMIEPVE